jgi:ParB family chromosome partitioning protein
MSEIHAIPLAEIDDEAMPRDRTGLDPEALAELQSSIVTSGLRMPVELFPLAEPVEGRLYGIVSGFRRVAVFRALAEYGLEGYDTIPAFLRQPRDAGHAFISMVEENEIRAPLSPWERGRIALVAARAQVFPSVDDAIDALYPAANAVKRARLRATVLVVELLEHTLTTPESLSERCILRIAAAITAGFGEIIDAAVRQTSLRDPESQWQAMLPYLAESEHQHTFTDPAPESATRVRDGRPRRLLRIRPQLIVRREVAKDGYILRFTGLEATGGLMDHILDEIERLYGRDY